MFFFISVVFIVPIGEDKFSIFYDPKFVRKFINEVSIMRNKKNGSFERFESFFNSFTRFIVEVVGWLVEDKKVIGKFTEKSEEKTRTFSS
jgi:hypothetical protein